MSVRTPTAVGHDASFGWCCYARFYAWRLS